ncbi:hypothetical protein BH10PSE6_BH10PSE6_06370 [soil metagenome]
MHRDGRQQRGASPPVRCGAGTPVDNNRRRRAAMVAWTDRGGSDTDWVSAPVLNGCTRLSVEMVPATGHLVVAGWKPDGRGSAEPATAMTTFQGFCTAV